MLTPTQKVTRNAQRMLDSHDVLIAVRVEWGADAFAHAEATRSPYLWMAPFAHALDRLRLLRRASELRDQPAVWGILALTTAGDRIVLAASPWNRKLPTGVNEVLPRHAPLQADFDLLESELVPILTVAHRRFVVNGVDFKALMKAVEAGTVPSPELAQGLARFHALTARPPYV